MLNVKVILGSTRTGRFSEKLLPWVTAELDTTDGVTHEVLDLKEWDIPFYNEPISPAVVKDGAYQNDVVREFAVKIAEADAFLVIAPEYNHGYSAILKNALDSVYSEWNKKVIGFVSYGSVGGGRVVEQLRAVAVELQMAPIRNAVHIQAPWNLLDESGNLNAGSLDEYDHSLTGTVEQLVWWGNALQEARSK